MSEKIVQLIEEVMKGQIRELVGGNVEKTLNGSSFQSPCKLKKLT
ncbi:hypothetical protein CLNEO_14840 [Anaerotignum neopropionicum]|uniref:Uncharacterized protein n=1 Tax=Anaerotignum neopropionicum TaxID=36847 RepID=A0A136WEJ5_9FIRM|nr:hypothetical protein [Anaerotignum neopropionicum]KXL52942.1 hypothetical protein CLNEO_14840 [Anaerotignum neopropionicum]